MDLHNLTVKNKYYRNVVQTIKKKPGAFQLVLMTLKPKEDIGFEKHPGVTQFFYIISGLGQAIVEDEHFALGPGISIIVPPGNRHNIINESKTKPLKLFTIYTSVLHKAGEKNLDKE